MAIAVASRNSLASGLSKARRRLLPLLAICYLVAYMDRANISFAAESMNHDLKFGPAVYGLGAGLFFVSYALCEIPSNRALLHFGARRWLARIMLTWGLIAAAMIFVRSASSFYGIRLLLGAAEAGYFPGVIFYLSLWFPPVERARAISRFYIAFPLSNLVMGAAAGGLLRLNGHWGLTGWQWLFLVEAAPAVLLSVLVWKLLPDGPETAPWLTSAELGALQTEIAAGAGASPEECPSPWEALRNGRVWLSGLMYCCGLGAYYAITFSLPLVLGQLTRWNAAHVGYLIAGTGLLGAVFMLGMAAYSDRGGRLTGPASAVFLLMGLSFLVGGTRLQGMTAIAALLLSVCCWFAVQGPMLSVCTSLVSGRGCAIAVAAMNTCGIAGGFLGPYWMGWMRERTGGYAVGIGALVVPCVVGALCLLLLTPGPRTQDVKV